MPAPWSSVLLCTLLHARVAHETVKVNQCQYIYIEDCDISGADDNAVDFVAVQYGHVHGNRIHNAQDWCMYTKGGFEGSEVWWYPMGERTHASDVGTVGHCNKHHCTSLGCALLCVVVVCGRCRRLCVHQRV